MQARSTLSWQAGLRTRTDERREAAGRYSVSLARSQQQIEAALRLRFAVFNLELGEGLDTSVQTGLDRDRFDEICDHLIVEDGVTGEVIGTYRLLTLEMVKTVENFYSAEEFALDGLPAWIIEQSVELGRACIAEEHRNRQVLFLLWSGIAQYILAKRKRFLFGCCSLTSQEPGDGIQLFQQLKERGYVHPELSVTPQPGFECDTTSFEPYEVKIPRLFQSYLSIGAKVCSSPAIDRLFKTIDFLVLFDVAAMDERTRRLFFANS